MAMYIYIMEKLIVWNEVSRLLTGNIQNIRSNKVPKKYKESVKELTDFVEYWIQKNKR